MFADQLSFAGSLKHVTVCLVFYEHRTLLRVFANSFVSFWVNKTLIQKLHLQFLIPSISTSAPSKVQEYQSANALLYFWCYQTPATDLSAFWGPQKEVLWTTKMCFEIKHSSWSEVNLSQLFTPTGYYTVCNAQIKDWLAEVTLLRKQFWNSALWFLNLPEN